MNPGPILLVEDNPDDRELTLRALRKCKVANEVLTAEDGTAALRLLGLLDDELGVLPALVLLDIRLPKVNGLDILTRIRADPRTQYVPVVVLTSSAEDSDLRSAYDGGANSFLRKPINFAEFMDATRAVGLYWLLWNRVPEPISGV